MIQKAISRFHPSQQIWGTRAAYKQELLTSATLPLAVAMLDAGVVGVFGKIVFGISNTQFAMISASPMFANLLGFVWTRASRGKRKTVFAGMLMSMMLVLVAAVALLPKDDKGFGAAGLVLAVVIGRCLMAGIVTMRSAVWRMNFPRSARARMTGKFVLIATLIFALVPAAIGPVLDWNPQLFRVIYPVAAMIGIFGVVSYARIRVRQEPALLRSEREPQSDRDMPTRADGRPHSFVSVLREDRHFRTYMTWQFFAGVANMMGNTAFALFVIETIKDQQNANTLGMLLTATVPLACATLTVPLWSKLLDRQHIARYRISHGLTWVFGQSSCYVAALTGQLWLFFIPMMLRGVMQGGGMIAWNLGHNDFADKRLAALYMGIHQTLTGVRGAFAPFLGVWLLAGWEGFSWWGGDVPPWRGIGPQVFIITTGFAVVAWLGFWSFVQKLEAQGVAGANDG